MATANPPLVRAEGISERTGDVVFSCSGGQPNASLMGNLVLYLSVNVTNRVLSDGTSDVLLTVNGAPANAAARVTGVNAVTFNGLSIPLTAQGTAELRLQNLRANASQLLRVQGSVLTLYASFSGGSLLTFTNNQFTVGIPQTALLAASAGRIICTQVGSRTPDTITFPDLVNEGSVYATTRVTEGFASAFAPRSDISNRGADAGVRIIARYSGFPAGAHLYAPDAIAGSDADRPTSAGDFGIPASGGVYTPGTGQLLLIRVIGADPDGAGGTLAMAAPAAGPATLTSVSEVGFSSGAGYAVYEVVDANPAVRESALLPAFLGLAPGGATAETNSSVSLAAVSTVMTASSGTPIPRFVSAAAPLDCTVLNDCNASYFPRLYVYVNPNNGGLQLDSANGVGYVIVQNSGSGVLQWTASTPAPYLKISPPAGVNNGGFRVDAVFTGLSAGTYSTTVTVDAGPLAGTRTIPVTVTVTAGQNDPPPPLIQSIGNAADRTLTAVVPGSLATILASRFSGNAIQVTFDGMAGQVLFPSGVHSCPANGCSAEAFNVVVPAALSGRVSAQVRLVANNTTSAAFTVNVAVAAPAIFQGAVLNTDWLPNAQSAPAQVGSVLQIFATGLPAGGPITAKVHDRIVTPAYAGPAPQLAGVQQVNAQIPLDLPAMQTWVYVCSGDICSPPRPLWITR